MYVLCNNCFLSTLEKMADVADTQDVEEKFTEEIELLDGQARQEDLDTLLIEDKDVDQIDPDIVLGEKDDLLDAGGEDDQFEVLDCVGESSSEDKKDVQTEKNDKEDSVKESKKERQISPITFSSSDTGKGSSDSSKKTEKMEHRISDKLFLHTRYFVMKSNSYENVDIAKSKNAWSTPPLNEKKLDKAFQSCKNVLLIFSVKESGKFQGIARLVSGARKDIPPPRWVLPPGISSNSMSVFKLEWIHKGEVAFLHTLHLKNPWNENKPVKISRDGQEVEPAVGEQLCRLWLEHAEKPSSSPQRSVPSSRRQNQPTGRTGGHASHRHGLPVAPMPILPTVQFQQYMQHQAMIKGHHTFGMGSVPQYNPMSSGALSTSRLREARSHPLRKRSPSPRPSYRDRSPRYSRHRHDNHRHRDKERRGRHSDKRSSSASSQDSYEDYAGIRRDVLLNGSYEDYLREYSSRHSNKSQLAPEEFDAMVEDFLNKKH